MKNTAEKLEYQEQMNAMTKLNQQAFARTIWDDPQKVITIHTFWQTFAHGKTGNVRTIAELEMRRLEAILLKMTDINQGFYGANASAHVDTIGVNADNNVQETDDDIETIIPNAKEVVVGAETNLKEEDDKGRSLFNGKAMGDMPNQADLSKAAKELLIKGEEENAFALAKQYFGNGKYTPKKEGAKPNVWKDKQIKNWLISLKASLPKTKQTTEKKHTEGEVNFEEFGTTRNNLETEKNTLKDFAKRYVKLATSGTENAESAEKLAKLFFKHRGYSEAQINIWKQTITGNEDDEELDHFAILGSKFDKEGKLKEIDGTYEDFSIQVFDLMQEIQVTKPQLEDKQSLIDYMIDQVNENMREVLQGTAFKNKNGATYELYTDLHYRDLIERMVMANFSKLDSQATDNSEDGQEKNSGKVSNSKPEEQSIEELAKQTQEKAKAKAQLGTNIKDITVSIIKNGGVVEDTVDHPSYKNFYGEGHKFTQKESLEKHIAENFAIWREEYLNSLEFYPMKEFHRAIDTAYFGDVSVDDIYKEVCDIMIKPNGEILALLEKGKKKDEGDLEVRFPNKEELHNYITRIYENNKNAEIIDEEAAKAQEPETGTKSSTEEIKTEDTDKTTGEVEESATESNNSTIVKIAHIQNICNKAIKKGKDVSFILKDRKVAKLVENGGSIVNIDGTEVEYNTSAESLEQLRTDLQTLFDNTHSKKGNKLKEEQKTETVNQVKNTVSDENAEEESSEPEETTNEGEDTEETTEVDSSYITSLNQFRPAGKKMIQEGCSQHDLIMWARDQLLNRKMKEMNDSAIFTKTEAIDTFIMSMFPDFFPQAKSAKDAKVDNSEETTNSTKKETVEDLKAFIDAEKVKEGINYASLCKLSNSYAVDYRIEIKTKEILELVRAQAPELHKAYLEARAAKQNEEQEKVFVPEKISETKPTIWDKVKEFKTLDEIYVTSLELVEAGDWQIALNMTTELIKTGNIKGAEKWTDDMIAQWFDQNVLKKEVPETEEIQATEDAVEEELTPEFQSLQEASSGNKFRKALIEILTKHEDSPDLRARIVNIVRGGKADYARKMAKTKEAVIQNQINAAKLIAKRK